MCCVLTVYEHRNYFLCSCISLSYPPEPRKRSGAVWLQNGRAFIIGGIVATNDAATDKSTEHWSASFLVIYCPWHSWNHVKHKWTKATLILTVIIQPSATQLREMIPVVGSCSSTVYSPPLLLDETMEGQWTILSCLYELRLLCGKGNNIYAFGKIPFCY